MIKPFKYSILGALLLTIPAFSADMVFEKKENILLKGKISTVKTSKKFRNLDDISQYNENFITTDYLSINRNNGQLKINGKLKCVVKKISVNDLPKLNDEGKLF